MERRKKRKKQVGAEEVRKVTSEVSKSKLQVFLPHFIPIWLKDCQSTTCMLFSKIFQGFGVSGHGAGKEKEKGREQREREKERRKGTVRDEWGGGGK